MNIIKNKILFLAECTVDFAVGWVLGVILVKIYNKLKK
jgi:hypothetical protein